jgi:hypothetical protein
VLIFKSGGAVSRMSWGVAADVGGISLKLNVCWAVGGAVSELRVGWKSVMTCGDVILSTVLTSWAGTASLVGAGNV